MANSHALCHSQRAAPVFLSREGWLSASVSCTEFSVSRAEQGLRSALLPLWSSPHSKGVESLEPCRKEDVGKKEDEEHHPYMNSSLGYTTRP